MEVGASSGVVDTYLRGVDTYLRGVDTYLRGTLISLHCFDFKSNKQV